ncbi:MAG TPA: hypothetical protein DCR48_03370 [Flavobacteriales bacterium]|nr:hypothetical protein [Flavobacteriales bacterium]
MLKSIEESIKSLVSPNDGGPLSTTPSGDALVDQSGVQFPIENGIPVLIFPLELHEAISESRDFYEGRADQYDDTLHLTFFTHGLEENKTREEFIAKLNISPNSKVLEVACGTGRDSELLANHLDESGELHLHDISADMIRRAKDKMKDCEAEVVMCLSNGECLPYPDNYFDACYSFGALGEFPDKARALKEFARVTKVGGKIVVGDEGVPEWHRNTEFYKILLETNPMFAAELPIKDLPVEARKVRLEWVIGGTFYLFDFEVGEGEPTANFDYTIPGHRGGSYRSRYAGKLEGVTAESKELAWQMVQNKGTNMHDWLTKLIEEEAKKTGLK